jgi:pimeloyl-ACP methyl ester carboxylesterase
MTHLGPGFLCATVTAPGAGGAASHSGETSAIERDMRQIFFLTFVNLAAVIGNAGQGAAMPSRHQAAQARDRSAAARESYAEIPGARIWFKDTGGSGVPVVFLHAATGNSQAWEYQLPAFTTRGYRVIVYDRRGWGRTVIDPAGPQPGTAADDLQALMNYLCIDRFHLVATAAGGFVALDYALSFPQRLRSLVIANSIGGVQDEEYLALGRRLRPAEFNALPPDFRELGPAYRAAAPGGTQRWLELEKTSRSTGPRATAQTMRNQVTFSLLETLSVPTLFITGGADLYAPPPVMRLFTARIRNAESLVVPDVGHSAYWEQPEIFNRAVLKFIRKH